MATDAQVKQRREARWQHGLRSEFAETGNETALTDRQRSRLAEIRADLETPDGAQDILRDRTARLVLLCEWGEAHLRDIAEEKGGTAAFEAKMLQRYVSVLESARRHLELLIRLQGRSDGGPSAGDVLDAIRSKREQSE